MNISELNNWLLSEDKQSLIMGILNVTPDSFFFFFQFLNKNSAIGHALKMIEEGADIIDIGGESTKPFSSPVSLDEELSRVLPVIEDLRKETDVCISIDTTKSEVANQALEMGASIINDVSAMEFDEKMIGIALKFDCPIVLMHMKGIPKNMQENPHYSSLISEIITYLNARIDFVLSKGIDRKKIIIDPGIGFGKSVENNFEIINNLNQFVDLGYPVMLGASRKSFIGITLDVPEDKRVEGSLAANIIGFQKGVSVFRVHDVNQTRKALTITKKIFNSDHLIN